MTVIHLFLDIIENDKQQYAGIYKFFKLYACSNNDNQIETNCWVFCSQFSNKWINAEGGLIKAENTYVNDTSKFSIIDKGTTDDNNQIQLKSINNDKYLSIEDNNNLVDKISISIIMKTMQLQLNLKKLKVVHIQ